MGDAAVKGPGFQPMAGIRPVPPPVSLLTAARRLPALPAPSAVAQDGAVPQVTGQPGWKGGVSWRSVACHPGYGWPFCGAGEDREIAGDIVDPGVYPYMIYVPYRCDWVLPGEGDYRADAEAQLEAVTPYWVSNELWTGQIETDNYSLMTEAVDVSAADAVHPVTGLETLMDAYYTCDSQGGGVPVVHTPMSVVISLMANHLVNQIGDVYYGPGCVVSPGPGYPIDGTGNWGPGGASAGAENQWMYLSGPVEVALGDIDVLPTEQEAHWDRRSNTYEVWAQRLVLARFDPCCVFACNVFNPSPPASVV